MRRKGVAGFTLVEVTIILLVLVVLGGILLPTIERFVDLARVARVREDVGMLAAIVPLFLVDTCNSFFRVVGDHPGVGDYNRVDMLVGDGDVPATDGLSGDAANWVEPFDGWGPNGPVFVDSIANQLALGDPFGVGVWGNPYPIPPSVFGCGFRGAYVQTPVSADPWGNRYMINVAFLGHCGSRCFGLSGDPEFRQQDVFVLSAGPDETVGTRWVVNGVVVSGDDQIALISSSGN